MCAEGDRSIKYLEGTCLLRREEELKGKASFLGRSYTESTWFEALSLNAEHGIRSGTAYETKLSPKENYRGRL